MTVELKTCSRCGIEKNLTDFSTLGAGRLDSWCRGCRCLVKRLRVKSMGEKECADNFGELMGSVFCILECAALTFFKSTDGIAQREK